jgi:hypothetical protein
MGLIQLSDGALGMHERVGSTVRAKVAIGS